MVDQAQPILMMTSRLRFRWLNGDDLANLYGLYRDIRVMRFVTGRPRTWAETERKLAETLANYNTYNTGLYAVEDRSTGHFIGRCGLEPHVEVEGLAGDLAWMFHPDRWGRGYGTEAAHALLDLGRQTTSLYRVFATADHRNVASISIMTRIGLEHIRSDDRGVEYEWRRKRGTESGLER